MSAFGGKADMPIATAECPLMTQSGHAPSPPIAGGRALPAHPNTMTAAQLRPPQVRVSFGQVY